MARHLTARLAWHDSGWNGNICSRPSSNSYCVGSRSLLSDRLRRDRNADLEDDAKNQSCDSLFPDYTPPCYWGINAFGIHPQRVLHRHAFADLRDTHAIEDEMPPFSVQTWPFRISFNQDEETRNRFGNYHPKLENRINQFFAAHHENESLVFLYLNYDNPVSGDQQLYAVVGCGLLREKGKPTRFHFSSEELKRYRSGKDMQHFPEVNWSRMLALDPNTVVRLPYQEYVRHVRQNPKDEDKLEEIGVLVSNDALVPSFKYVCDSMDDDQCLFLLHQLKKAFDRVEAHGIANTEAVDSLERIDSLIEHVWRLRGGAPGLANSLAYLAMLGDQTDEPKLDRAEQFIREFRGHLSSDNNLVAEVESLLTGTGVLEGPLKPFRTFLKKVQRGVASDPEILEPLMRLSSFSLSSFQIERILSGERPKEEPSPFGQQKISTQEVLNNPYVLAEFYVSTLQEPKLKWKQMEHPIKRDGPIGVFHIDAGLFPDDDFVENDDAFHIAPAGPQRIRALALKHLTEQAMHHADSFVSLDNLYRAILDCPIFYRRKFTLRKEALTSSNFLEHFAGRIEHVENASSDYFYLSEIKAAEELVERTIRNLTQRKDHQVDASWITDWVNCESEKLSKQITDFDAKGFRKERSEALATILSRSFVVLSGRPGSGKTYAVAEVVRRLLNAKEPVTTLAPTGKAVLRLATDAKVNAETIDKFLFKAWFKNEGVVGPEQVSARNLERLGDIKNLVIDESSMLDLPKLATLFRILEKQGLDTVRRVILVGDINQLPPIGLGRPFEDIVSWLGANQKRREGHHIHLETNCRQRNDMKILEAAELFVARNRYYDELLEELNGGGRISDGLKVVLWKDTDELAIQLDSEIAELVKVQVGAEKDEKHKGLNLLFGLDANGSIISPHMKTLRLESFQILTPYYGRYAHAARELNEGVHRNYKKACWQDSSGFSHGEKVIRLSNRYGGKPWTLTLSNGSIGVVNLSINGANPTAKFPFNDKSFSVAGSEYEEYDLAYAITVHKAQGSDFDHVFVVLSAHTPLLTRELVYTALTRSKESVTLFLESSEKSPLETALRRSAVLNRNSSVFDRPLDKSTLLQPESGERVDSKIEYIIYAELMKARDEGRLKFKHHERISLTLPSGNKTVEPDFSIETKSGTWYLEHLGMLDLRRYSHRWLQKRSYYIAAGLGDRLITTDDLNGVRSERLNQAINDICAENPIKTPDSKFSHHHYRLWDSN